MIYDVKYLEEADKKKLFSFFFQKLGSILQFESTIAGIFQILSKKFKAFLPSGSAKYDSNKYACR
jgi:hypothetical protein